MNARDRGRELLLEVIRTAEFLGNPELAREAASKLDFADRPPRYLFAYWHGGS